jgi:bacterial/archaeal transporter family protein
MATDSLNLNQIWPEASSPAPNSLAVRHVVVPEAALPLSHTGTKQGPILAAQHPGKGQTTPLIPALTQTIKTRWFWYAMASSLCWTGWAFTAKIGSREIPPTSMQFISAFGFVLISVGVLGRKATKNHEGKVGKLYALISGVLLALGGICLYGAYRTGSNTSVITAVTSLYPMVTVICAVRFLREKLNRLQVVGLFFAAAAMFMLSL